MAIERDVWVERRASWGAIWGGLFVIGGVQVVMNLFGAAVGLSAVAPTAGSAKGATIWMAVWAIVSTLSAYFFGGWVTGLTARARSSGSGILNSVILWGFATTIGILLLIPSVAGPIGASFGMVQKNAPAVAQNPQAIATITNWGAGITWGMFGTILIALACCIGGGALGGAQREEHEAGAPVTPPLVEREV